MRGWVNWVVSCVCVCVPCAQAVEPATPTGYIMLRARACSCVRAFECGERDREKERDRERNIERDGAIMGLVCVFALVRVRVRRATVKGERKRSRGGAYIVPPPNSDSHARACATATLAWSRNPVALGSRSRGAAPGAARSRRKHRFTKRTRFVAVKRLSREVRCLCSSAQQRGRSWSASHSERRRSAPQGNSSAASCVACFGFEVWDLG